MTHRVRALGIESNVVGHAPIGSINEPQKATQTCEYCGRVGTRGFMYTDAGTVCANYAACMNRARSKT
jgi:hypothetical protein